MRVIIIIASDRTRDDLKCLPGVVAIISHLAHPAAMRPDQSAPMMKIRRHAEMRKDFDPTTIRPDGRSAAKARLFDPEAGGPWRGNVEGKTLNAQCTVLAYGNETPGEGPRLHVHPYDEIFIVVAGNARFFVGETVIDATAGDVLLGPAGVPHRFENLGPGRLQTIDVHTAPRWLQVDL
jgi:mannose-6-phosphate isomerase-like protein (cupin superfamily)